MKNIFKADGMGRMGIIGLITGFVNGLLGSGGGIILVPAMQKFLDVKVVNSHATAIAIILPLSIISGIIYLKDTVSSGLEWKVVLYVSVGGFFGGLIGSKFLAKMSNKMIHKLFGVFMIISSIRILKP